VADASLTPHFVDGDTERRRSMIGENIAGLINTPSRMTV
jgi:hypothetical protein